MEFGFSRFLEMFEERFGRTVTTAILGLIGLAVSVYSATVIANAAISAYHLIKSANLIDALGQESAASHIIIFTAQIGLTFIVLAFIWRQFYQRRIKALEVRATDFKQYIERFKTEIQARLDGITAKQEGVMKAVDAIKAIHTATQVMHEEIKKHLPLKSPPGPLHPSQEPPDTPEKT